MSHERGAAKKLDTIIELLEDLIIVQAMRAHASNGDIRKFLGVDMNRVTKISKMIKGAKSR